MTKEQLYKKFAKYYDQIYEKMDHVKECEFIEWAVNQHQNCDGNKLLDVACGTGRHADLLKNRFKIVGVDLNPEMLKIAQNKVLDVEFTEGDMKTLDLKEEFDVIICMFSAMNYNTTLDELKATLKNFYNHLYEGGILIFDLGINQENWIEGLVSVDTVVDEKFKLARICQSHLEEGIFNANFVFLIKEDGKVDFDIDQHKLGVFPIEDVINLMGKTGFENFIYTDFTQKNWDVLSGDRPVFVGVK
ncbi:MAG: ubiquinone/menaquinone biosynthesis methyltransferase [Methanobacterium sp. PtaU1.Bin242]|nr:MAG: ubiquinone/menaquinone biosynthesis methyltransferase [Methanobacterium sp. PtaU1.Bin242]